ncbi:hypothetical protein KEM56_006604 [Ascosphaera pollenicola]|nr:hypothetical protein KEM56_006604 [Ascosphaera pollenicola]
MLEPIELKAHPYCTDCLSWSADGQLAVAAGEFVFILVRYLQRVLGMAEANCHFQTPRYVGSLEQAARSGDPKIRWDTVKLQVNQFTYEEWPQLRHQPLNSFSPGEELSNSHVTKLEWSPDGVGPFTRAVLAVQTSNLLLSIWGLEDGNTRWKRLMVVNQSLRSYFQPMCDDNRVLLQKRQRIRSFSWSEALHLPAKSQFPEWRQGYWFYMVIANDNREIVFLRFDPEKRSTSGVKPLNIRVCSSCIVEDLNVGQSYHPIRPGSIFSNIMTSKPCISDVTWGNWFSNLDFAGEWLSNIAVLDGTQPRIYQVAAWLKEVTTVQTYEESLAGKDTSNPDSPIVDRPRESAWISIGIPATDDEEAQQYRMPYMTGDTIVGDRIIAARCIGEDAEAVHVAEHLGKVYTQEWSFGELHRDTYEVQDMSAKSGEDLQRRIEAFRNTFDLEYDLGGKSVARIWGLAKYIPKQRHMLDESDGHPDEYTAACFTLHPTEMAEHSMPSEALMRIVISSTSDVDHDAGYVSDDDGRPPRELTSYAIHPFNFITIPFADEELRRRTRHEIMANDSNCTLDLESLNMILCCE